MSKSFSRRLFLKGTLVLTGSAALAGCSKSDSEPIYVGGGYVDNGSVSDQGTDLSDCDIFYGTTSHNCGGGPKCISKAYARNGRIIRLVTDDSTHTAGGVPVNPGSMNCTNTKTCSRCKSYLQRLYHQGRLLYPLKQTKKRGDLNGFVRISWEQAIDEVARKHRAIYKAYGPEAIHPVEGNGNLSVTQGGLLGPFGKSGHVFKLVGGHSVGWDSYSFHQMSYFQNNYTGFEDDPYLPSMSSNMTAVYTKTIFLWGNNTLTTQHYDANAAVNAVQIMKNRDPDAKIYFIGPELNDGAVTIADEWIQSRPGRDGALISAMIYEMIINTFDDHGNIITDQTPWLDVDYIDTMIYGFFDSPGYWINWEDGTFDFDRAAPTGEELKTDDVTKQIWVNPVPAGRSLSAWIMGDDDRLTKAMYKNGGVYTAKKLADVSYNSLSASDKGAKVPFVNGDRPRNLNTCTYSSTSSSPIYELKKQFNVRKNADWAHKITGVKPETIRRLARIYTDPASQPIQTSICGAFQKRYNGIYDIFMIESLLMVTKSWGQRGNKFACKFVSKTVKRIPCKNIGFNIPDNSCVGNPYAPTAVKPVQGVQAYANNVASTIPFISVTQWYNAISYGFGDALRNENYSAQYIPDWTPERGFKQANGQVYQDNSGVKALVKRVSSSSRDMETQYSDTDGVMAPLPMLGKLKEYSVIVNGVNHTFFEWDGRNLADPLAVSGTPVHTGFRFIMNAGGNILSNQSMNTNDHKAVYEALPLGTIDPDNGNDFCIVTIDNFLSPSARWSDYVLPNTATWEQQDVLSIDPSTTGANVYMPVISTPPGQTKTARDLGNEYLKHFETLEPKYAGAAKLFCGGEPDQSLESLVKKEFHKRKADAGSPFYDMTWDEFMKRPYSIPIPDNMTVTEPLYKHLRENLDLYLTSANKAAQPFIKLDADGYFHAYALKNAYKMSSAHPLSGTMGYPSGAYYPTNNPSGYGNEYAETLSAPNRSLRMQCYSDILTWQYDNRFSKWHGHLLKHNGTSYDTNGLGQKIKDFDGDSEAYPIPMYYPIEDYFNDAYGVFAGKNAMPEKPLFMTTAHDRYRSHSTHSENPIMRELSHRIKGGGFSSGNDWKEYATAPESDGKGGLSYQRLNGAMAKGDLKTATWSELWMNDDDASERGIADGDVVEAKNPIGAVRCIARVTMRCVSGHVGLHEGSWYDPNPADGTDDGGNPNTLMAHKPSRIDQGNVQQQAYVSVRKVSDDELRTLGFRI